MKRVASLGGVSFSLNSLFVEEEEKAPTQFLTEAFYTSAGTKVVYANRITTPNITLVSKEYSWITKDERAAIIGFFADPSASLALEYVGGDTVEVYPDVSRQLQITQIYEGADKFTVSIPLLKKGA